MLRFLFYPIIDVILPPREDTTRVATLTSEDLAQMRGSRGLPYRNDDVRALVWECKYRKNPRALALAGAFLADELLGIAAECVGKPVLVPIPMHKSRRRLRGHNQTEALCEAALQTLGEEAFDYVPKALVRTRATAPQQRLPRHLRLVNVKNSMKASETLVRGRVCIVVDDVSTTGATLKEAVRALHEAGAREVHTTTLAYS